MSSARPSVYVLQPDGLEPIFVAERSRTPAALTRSLSRGSRNIGAGLPCLRDFRGGSRIRRLSAWPVLLMPPPLSEWLPEDHLVWTVVGAVGQMDLGRLRRRIGWVGGSSPYGPAMMA